MSNADPQPIASPPAEQLATNAAEEALVRRTAPAKPRLSILHLLVWTAISAATITVIKCFGWSTSKSFRFEDAYWILFSIYSGVVVGGVLMCMFRRWRGLPFPTEPGEWLLVVQGVAVLLMALSASLQKCLYREEGIAKLMFVVLAISGLIPVVRFRGSILWRLLLIAVAGILATPLFTIFPGGWDGLSCILYSFFGLFCFVVLDSSIVVGIDYKRGIHHGWAHGAGVVTVFLFAVFHLVLMVYEAIF